MSGRPSQRTSEEPKADPAAESDPAAEAEPAALTYLIGRLDRVVRQQLNAILEPYELSIAQFTTLSVLRRRSGLSNAQLARRALILPQSMIQVLLGLERRGLVEREPDPAHNRVLRARLTDSGLALVRAAEQATQDLEARLVAAVGEPRAAATAEVMRAWTDLAADR